MTADGPAVAPPALRAEDLYRFFRTADEETLALRGVSITVHAGELVVVAGPSGSGKSTLLQCLAGLDEPDGGYVTVGGARLSHRPEAERARIRAAGIGVLFQQANLVEHLTVEQNVDLARRLAGRRQLTVPTADLLAQLGVAEVAGARPATLSGGENSRAGLAVALANDPGVLIADEPTGELDGVSEQRLLDLLRERCSLGVAVLVASHSPAVVAVADRVVRMADGRVHP